MGDKFLLTKGSASSLSNGTTEGFAATLGATARLNTAKTTADSAAISSIAKTGITLLANYEKVKTSTNSLLKDLGFDD